MLLKELHKVSEIDNRINTLHKELIQLYNERSKLMQLNEQAISKDAKESNTPVVAQADDDKREDWAEKKHQQLEMAWNLLDISIPTYRKLQDKLLKAYDVIEKIGTTRPEIAESMDVLLVPPTKVMGFPVKKRFRQQQSFVTGYDNIAKDVKKAQGSREWRILVMYADREGLYLGKPQTIIEEQAYMIGEFDARALGAQEYMALSLQLKNPIDEGTSTILLKNFSGQGSAPCATFARGSFSIQSDEICGIFGDDRFRPAVEIN
ncbi:hypothetical protein CYG49_02585 [Candidatus Saccharibacteria bacterium]|nr:MAG: hypothetical protein CYG49_02585 [Candidatus Saccharibacteria bacterium]